jgi:integrase
MADRSPLRGRRRLPRPIREQQEQWALDAAIATAPQPYRLIFTLLRETGMRVGEVLELRWGDVTLESGREALRVREAKNGVERVVVLGRRPRHAPCAACAQRSVHDAVQRRVNRLGESARRAVQLAAVAGVNGQSEVVAGGPLQVVAGGQSKVHACEVQCGDHLLSRVANPQWC